MPIRSRKAKTAYLALMAMLFWNCQPPSSPDEIRQTNPAVSGKRLGHLRSLYPVLSQDGRTWEIEMNLDSVNVLSPLAQVQAYASDSLGKELLRSKATEWYSQEDSCLFTPLNQSSCLHFRFPDPESPGSVVLHGDTR